MPKGIRLSADQRVLMRTLYETDADKTVEEIAATLGVHIATVFDHARAGGWVRADRAAAPAPADPSNRRAILNTLWLAATQQAAALSAKSVAGGRDIDAQALMASVRTVEKLMDMDDGAGAPGASAPDAAACRDEGPEDIDEFRAEIARRLEGLLGRGPGTKCSPDDPAG